MLLDGGLNLNDPFSIKESELSLALNADFRQKGVVRSRDGRASLYTVQGTDLIGTADGALFSVGTSIFRNGVDLGTAITGATAVGTVKLWNVATEVWLLSAQNNYKVEGTTVRLWGITAPTVAPTAVALAGGAMATGAYYYKYTYARYQAGTLVHESNPSPVSAVVNLSGGNLRVTFTGTAPSDTQVTHLNVYRTLVNGPTDSDEYFLDQSITLPTVTATSSNTDAQLGALVETDNDPPPTTGLNSIAGPGAYATIFVAYSNVIAFSKGNRPESFPPDFTIEVGVPFQTIQGLVDWAGLIYVFTKTAVFFVQGTDSDSFFPVRTQASRGLIAPKAVVATEKGILYLAYDGVYAFNGQSEVKLTADKVDCLFRGETINTIAPINRSAIESCWLVYFNGKMFLGYPTATNTVPDKVLVYDFEEFKFSVYDYSLNMTSAFVDADNQRLLVGDTDGTVWQLETGENDAGSSFQFKIRGKELTGLAQQSPAYVRLDVMNEDENSVAVRFLSKTVVQHTVTLTDSEERKRRVIGPDHYDSLQMEVESQVTGRVAVGPVELL